MAPGLWRLIWAVTPLAHKSPRAGLCLSCRSWELEVACFGWQEAAGRQDCHSPLITALLITDKLQVPVLWREHTLVNVHGSQHTSETRSKVAALSRSDSPQSLVCQISVFPFLFVTRHASPYSSEPAQRNMHLLCFYCFLSFNTPLIVPVQSLLVWSPSQNPLGHGSVCLNSKKMSLGTGSSRYLQPVNRQRPWPAPHHRLSYAVLVWKESKTGMLGSFSHASLWGWSHTSMTH